VAKASTEVLLTPLDSNLRNKSNNFTYLTQLYTRKKQTRDLLGQNSTLQNKTLGRQKRVICLGKKRKRLYAGIGGRSG
jgi:hypothetical protein